MSDAALFPIIQATSTSKYSNASPMERGPGARAGGARSAAPDHLALGYRVGPSGGTGTVMAGLSVPPSISKTLPVTHDDASLAR